MSRVIRSGDVCRHEYGSARLLLVVVGHCYTQGVSWNVHYYVHGGLQTFVAQQTHLRPVVASFAGLVPS